jgi:outer membrane biosynthesis protein TonB
MSKKKHTIIYSAEDIQQYLSGKLTPLQMNAIEKAALDDPFLAEAMEGYEGMPAGEWETALTAAKQQFAEKEAGAKIIVLPGRKNNWLKIAAAVLLIGGTAAMAYYIFNKKEAPQIAKIESAAIPDSSNTVIPDTSRITVITAAPENKSAETVTVQKATEQADIVKKSKAGNEFVYRPSPAKTDDLIVADKVGEENLESRKAAETSVANVPPPAPIVSLNSNANLSENNTYKSFSKAANSGMDFNYDKSAGLLKAEGRKDQPFNHSFYAQVMAPDNTPLPFANISIKSENFGTYTDVKGNFRLAAVDSVLTIEVKSVGYVPKIYTIKSNLVQNKITLVEEDMAAKEKTVISGYASAKAKTSRRATLVKDSVINVEPADGWDNYNTYVTNNIVIPDELIANNIHGQVELSFDVTENGNIANIKVDRSLCNNCDEVARRLIEQGPQWKVKKGKKGKGKITLQF